MVGIDWWNCLNPLNFQTKTYNLDKENGKMSWAHCKELIFEKEHIHSMKIIFENILHLLWEFKKVAAFLVPIYDPFVIRWDSI